jgi:hypothetical protein
MRREMMNVRTDGLGTKEELDRHLAELEEKAPAEDPPETETAADPLNVARREIAMLR